MNTIEAALFSELGSSLVSLEGAKAVVVCFFLLGHVVQQAGASSAYSQAMFGDEAIRFAVCRTKTYESLT